ncbi:hypothetical protein HHI36_022107 [Cryptolaemus montrouzieri]|uniref:RING-type E3 ubiquitin transferase n=1 Tax=Cryptolaemus montrouzieri TaxID=559131 RepID=A0ABD2MYQ8_9CUCU
MPCFEIIDIYFGNHKMADILECALHHYECPICKEYASPPIRQCAGGHVICNDCFYKVSLCPTCRGKKTYYRSRLLEILHDKVIFPCKYREEGCNKFIWGRDIVEHQVMCTFETKNCPLNYAATCFWTGAEQNILPHCFKLHPEMTRKGGYNTFTIENIKDITKATPIYTVIKAHGQGFKFCRCLYEKGHMSWRVIFVSDYEEKDRYAFRIEFKGDRNVYLNLQGTIADEEEKDVFVGKGHQILDAQTIKKLYENNEGTLEYTLLIIDTALDSLLEEIANYKI